MKKLGFIVMRLNTISTSSNAIDESVSGHCYICWVFYNFLLVRPAMAEWSDWPWWTVCLQICCIELHMLQEHYQQCNNPAPGWPRCKGVSYETKECNPHSCPSKK